MVQPTQFSEDFSEGPAPMDLADLGGASAQSVDEAPAPGPLGAAESLAETSAPPAPSMFGELDEVTDGAPTPEATMGDPTEYAGAEVAPGPSDIHAGVEAAVAADLGGAPAPRDDIAGIADAAISGDAGAPSPLEELGSQAGGMPAVSETGGPAPMSMEALGQIEGSTG